MQTESVDIFTFKTDIVFLDSYFWISYPSSSHFAVEIIIAICITCVQVIKYVSGMNLVTLDLVKENEEGYVKSKFIYRWNFFRLLSRYIIGGFFGKKFMVSQKNHFLS